MKTHLQTLFLALMLTCSLNAQVITDPVAFTASIKQLNQEKVYYKIVLDINHDGIDDMLIAPKLTQQEIAVNKWDSDFNNKTQTPFQPNLCQFAVFIGLKTGGYIYSNNIAIDLDKYYFGYIDEVKQYGIVSVVYSTEDNGTRLGGAYQTIYCYTIEKNHLKETKLVDNAGLYYLKDNQIKNKPNAIFDEYLSDAHRTQVPLQEVTP